MQLWTNIRSRTLILSAVGFAVASIAFAAGRLGQSSVIIPAVMNYQGRLSSSAGVAVADGSYTASFSLFNVATGGSPVWSEQVPVATRGGVFNATLGTVVPFPSGLFTRPLWIETTINGRTLSPRQRLGTVAYAFSAVTAQTALTVPGNAISTAMLQDNAVTYAKIAQNAVQSSKIYDGSVQARDMAKDPDGLAKVTGNAAFINGGRLGIGTPDPNALVNIFSPGGSNPISAMSIDVGTFGTGDNSLASYFMRARDMGSGQTAFLLRGDGMLGLGTDNPQSGLHVTRDIRTNGFFYADGHGWGGAPAIDLAIGDNDTGLGWGGDGVLRFYSNGVRMAELSPSGFAVVAGAKNAVVPTVHYGNRALNSVESAEVKFTDEGTAKLEHGSATVTLDPIYLETVEGTPIVQVTAYGNTSLYVSKISERSFEVKARSGDGMCRFAWQVSAHRNGFAGTRLEKR